jgi:hypothetical protein
MTDHLGRHGIGVGLVQDGVRQELTFDPATSTALETLGVATSKSVWDNYLPAGTVLGYTTYVTAGLVNPRTATLPATKTRAQVRDLSRHRRHREPASGSRCLLAGPCGRPVGQGPVRPRSD